MPSPRYWREIPTRYRLEGGRCPTCGKVTYPKRRVCPACRHDGMEVITLSRTGRVVTSTTIHVAPTEFQMEAPYPMAVVETPEGARLMVQVADARSDDVKPGLEVALEFRCIQREGHSGILCYGHKAVPVR
jgi:uncharacterized OB-fold protein